MLSFSFRTEIADIDSTVEGELQHPSLVLVLEIDDIFILTCPDFSSQS